jgi:phosphoribosylformylglycinamidine synthase
MFVVQTEEAASKPANNGKKWVIVEFGPRLNFSTAWSTNAITIINQCGITSVKRIERSRRLLLELEGADVASFDTLKHKLFEHLHDKMTECVYEKPLESFALNVKPEVRVSMVRNARIHHGP